MSLEPLIIGAADLATTIALITEDKKVSLLEVLVSAPSLISAVNKLIGVDYASLEAEVKSLSDADKAKYNELFKQHFDLKDDAIEANVEAGFAIVLSISKALLDLMGSLSKVKAA